MFVPAHVRIYAYTRAGRKLTLAYSFISPGPPRAVVVSISQRTRKLSLAIAARLCRLARQELVCDGKDRHKKNALQILETRSVSAFGKSVLFRKVLVSNLPNFGKSFGKFYRLFLKNSISTITLVEAPFSFHLSMCRRI